MSRLRPYFPADFCLAPPAHPSAASASGPPAPAPFDVTSAFCSLGASASASTAPSAASSAAATSAASAAPSASATSTDSSFSAAAAPAASSAFPSSSSSAAAAALSSLPYLDAYLRECLRLYSTAPNGVLKEVPAEGPPARIGPYEAQPGAVVWAPFWGLHLSSLNWERPMHFEPERWLGHDPRTAGAMSASRCPLSAAVSAIRAATGAAPITATAETTATTATTATDTAAAAIAANAAASTAAAAPAPAPAAASTEAAASTGAAAAAAASAKSIRFMPFGDGARNCVGQHLALLQLKPPSRMGPAPHGAINALCPLRRPDPLPPSWGLTGHGRMRLLALM
ncbi:Benzoate 4-monooxygenase [Tetrabaena socialis]|uniref:Benzoate 4-monooxygenase n=1 Tax=Tetrabaena socialis TaxID=47790 RepID=A0A2J7ZXG5_9CHLO|nr:Benzoate 4-monooxygenase [Tetrabaena socialis]|eukprot:PNH04959.1 Benzoate 4-monooxygenase [Tetrabaena socialis]